MRSLNLRDRVKTHGVSIIENVSSKLQMRNARNYVEQFLQRSLRIDDFDLHASEWSKARRDHIQRFVWIALNAMFDPNRDGWIFGGCCLGYVYKHFWPDDERAIAPINSSGIVRLDHRCHYLRKGYCAIDSPQR